ncbi:hypothetical protein RFI_17369 [Reticulomyxa filosa]|uniref:Uncharacterized protein n=1 Tax=Reticulomyxa filosa TaxID=46433 RepID=X6N1F0_RETFI|nr:hypothetical protein RFI_17369 [Reticulomyxa filosa]|eukprot:ETO19861.1 hypothetical protein RFI_17369 [Reticulomyxa filosa]
MSYEIAIQKANSYIEDATIFCKRNLHTQIISEDPLKFYNPIMRCAFDYSNKETLVHFFAHGMNQSIIPHYNDLVFSRVNLQRSDTLTSSETRDYAYVARILSKTHNGLFFFEKDFLNSLNHFKLFDWCYFEKSGAFEKLMLCRNKRSKRLDYKNVKLEADLYYFDLMKGVYVVEKREGKEISEYSKKLSLFAEGHRFTYSDYRFILKNESFFLSWFIYLEECDETGYLKYLLTRTPMDNFEFLCKTFFWALGIRHRDDQKVLMKQGKKKDEKTKEEDIDGEENYVISLKDYYCECGCLFCSDEGYQKHLQSKNPCSFANESNKAFLLLNKLPTDIINMLVDYIHPVRFLRKPNEKEQFIILSLYKAYRYAKCGSPFLKVKKIFKMTEDEYNYYEDTRVGGSTYCVVAKTF